MIICPNKVNVKSFNSRKTENVTATNKAMLAEFWEFNRKMIQEKNASVVDGQKRSVWTIRNGNSQLIMFDSTENYCKVAERWDFHFWVSFEGKNTELTPH